MTDSDLVSVILPTCDRPALLREAIGSILAQTYPAVELIVVDDGSTGETPALLETYRGRLCMLRQENRGVSAARNAGFRQSRGKYVTFLDDDDLIYPEKLASQVAYLQAHPEVRWANCRHDHIGPAGELLSHGGFFPYGQILPELLRANFLWVGAPLIDRAVLEQVGGFDENLAPAADYDLWLRISAAGYALGSVQRRLGAYRLHPGSMVTQLDRTEEEVFSILDRFFQRPDLPPAARAVRERADAAWRLWFSRRYYAAGAYPAARRSLSLAIQRDPSLAVDRSRLEQAFLDEVLDPRSPDPLRVLRGVLDNLPPEVRVLAASRSALTARAYFWLALVACARDDPSGARRHLERAYAPGLAASLSAADCVEAVTRAAASLPLQDPVGFVEHFLTLLPPPAVGLRRARAGLFARVHTALGFECFTSGHKREAGRHFLAAARLAPGSLRNRGVRAALVKTLPAFLSLSGREDAQ